MHLYRFVVIFLLLPAVAQARPVSYAEGWMLMSLNDRMQFSQMASYSPTAWYALGVRNDFMRGEDTHLVTATADYLLQRWNMPESQANIYLQTGLGFGKNYDIYAPAATFGVEADWESRRYIVSYENRAIASSVVEQSFSQKARIGIAPYIGGYEDVHSWLMLQIDHQPSEEHSLIVTPFIRLFNRQAMGEAGISNRGDVLLNLIYQF